MLVTLTDAHFPGRTHTINPKYVTRITQTRGACVIRILHDPDTVSVAESLDEVKRIINKQAGNTGPAQDIGHASDTSAPRGHRAQVQVL